MKLKLVRISVRRHHEISGSLNVATSKINKLIRNYISPEMDILVEKKESKENQDEIKLFSCFTYFSKVKRILS